MLVFQQQAQKYVLLSALGLYGERSDRIQVLVGRYLGGCSQCDKKELLSLRKNMHSCGTEFRTGSIQGTRGTLFVHG